MKRQLKLWFARILVMSLMLTQTLTINAQTVSDGDAVDTSAVLSEVEGTVSAGDESVSSGDTTEGGVVESESETDPAGLKSIEVLQYPYQDTFYSEFIQRYGINQTNGLKLKLVLNDGSELACELFDETYNMYELSFEILNAEGKDSYSGDIGEYQMKISMLDKEVLIPYKVVAVADMEDAITLGQEVTLVPGEQTYKLSLTETGVYYTSHGASVFDKELNQIASINGFRVEEAGDYYVMYWCEENVVGEKLVINRGDALASDTVYTLEANEVIYKNGFSQPGWYKATDTETVRLYRYNVESDCWNILTNVFYAGTDDVFYLSANVDVPGTTSFEMVNAAQLILGSTSSATSAAVYEFTPEVSGVYNITLSGYDTEGNAKYLQTDWYVQDKDGNYLHSQYIDRKTNTGQLALEGGKKYIINIKPAEWNQAAYYNVLVEQGKNVADVKLVNGADREVFYYALDTSRTLNLKGVELNVIFEDSTGIIIDSNSPEWNIYVQYSDLYDKNGEWVPTDENGCYPVGKYDYTYFVGIDRIPCVVPIEIVELSNIKTVLSETQPMENLVGNGKDYYAKIVIDERGTYKFDCGAAYTYAKIYKEDGTGVFDEVALRGQNLALGAGTYYIKLYTPNDVEYGVTMERLSYPEKMEGTVARKTLYNALGDNNAFNLQAEVAITLDNGQTVTAQWFDEVWSKYSLGYTVINANDKSQVYTTYNLPMGDYILKISNGYNSVTCEIPFTVTSVENAPKLEVGAEHTNEYRYNLYQMKVEDGIYHIDVPADIKGGVFVYSDNLSWVMSYSNYGDNIYSNDAKLADGTYYIYSYSYNWPEKVTFTVEKYADIASLECEEDSRLEIVYGTWGYSVGNSISGNQMTTSGNMITTSGNSYRAYTSFKQGDEIQGMITTTISGNNYSRETFIFNVVLQALLEDNTSLDIAFNSSLWDAFGFVEKVYTEEGSGIYADENGYAAIGDYLVEFVAQGKKIQLPFYVVEGNGMRDIRKTDISFTNQAYIGEAIQPIPVVEYNGEELVVEQDYTIVYSNNVEIGTATAVLTGIGKYSGVTTAEFEITEKELNKAEINENFPDEVLEAVKDIINCETEEELVEYLEVAIIASDEVTESLPDLKEEDVKVMDITIMVSFDAGETWENATVENFPEEGVDVLIPYPEGTSKDKNDFVVGHLITTGKNAGKMEYPKVTKMDEGLLIHIYSASPFVIAWDEVKEEVVPTTPPAPTTKPVETPAPVQKEEVVNVPVTYVVQRGDYLGKIAIKFGLSLKEIIAMNPQIKNPNLIYCGQVIVVGTTVTTQMGDEAVNSGIVEYYTVKRGDSLYKIARKNHLTINDIYRMNKELMKQRYIYAGQKVRIK